MAAAGASTDDPADLIQKFQFERLLNQDQAGRRITLLGTISSQPALLTAERAAFHAEDPSQLGSFAQALGNIKTLGNNDIYRWFLASSVSVSSAQQQTPHPDLKLNLIYPCTTAHIQKYSVQNVRYVVETPQIYAQYVRPWIVRRREAGRLDWVFNILEGRTEQEDVIYREKGEEGFVLLPDLNWDRKTRTSLHLLGLVERRDIWSVRDLRKKHIAWLRHMRSKLLEATVGLYPDIEADQLKLYLHYQPTYHHMHIHIAHVQLDAGMTQTVGKAWGLDGIIAHLQSLEEGDKGEEAGLEDVDFSYNLGEESELWKCLFAKLKSGEEPTL